MVVEAVGLGAAQRRSRRGCGGRRRRPRSARRARAGPPPIPAIRSDSLWRSSPAPRMTVVPVATVAARHRIGISSIAAATSAGPSSTARSVDDRTRRSAIGSPTPSSGRRPCGRSSMSRAHRAQDVDDGAAGRVDADVAEAELGVGMDRRPRRARTPPPRRRPGPAPSIACTASPPPTVQATAPSGAVGPLDRHAACPQHPLRVIARRDRLADRRPPLRPEPRQQDRRLHLRARHRRRVVDRPKRGTTDHGQGREGVVLAGVERRAHRAQRFDDTSHRTAAQ